MNARGKIATDGTFQLGTYSSDDGAVAGDHEVIVIQVISSPPIGAPKVKHEADHGAAIDTKHADYGTSGLKVTIQANGVNEPRLVVERAKVQPVRDVKALRREDDSKALGGK